ncbi:MAG: response regulator [Proteobacteria bacterium]|nr:response regulator [Pseudomonadota bacterium]
MHIAELNFLAVEDHEFQRGILLRILAGLGATKVAVAADGREALKIVMSPDTPIDIIISDLDMPGMDGIEFMRHLGKAGIPVAIILASGLEELLLDSAEKLTRDCGVRVLGVIEKPITPSKLDVLIKNHTLVLSSLARRRTAAPSFSLERMAEGLKKTLHRLLQIAQPAPAVDRSVLALVSGDDAAVEREILTEFRRINDNDAVMLKHAVDKREIRQVTNASERIKGACRTVGATALATVCERLERASGAGDWRAIEANMEAFGRELERLNTYCEAATAPA